jgi:hypothetical protein
VEEIRTGEKGTRVGDPRTNIPTNDKKQTSLPIRPHTKNSKFLRLTNAKKHDLENQQGEMD